MLCLIIISNTVLSKNYVKESGESTDSSQIEFVDYTASNQMFLNKYDKEVLTKEQCSLYNLWMHNPFSSIKFINGIAYFETDAVKITIS